MLIMGYLGAVIGAGFASGQEIVQFFVEYGKFGLQGTILAGVCFMVFGGLILSLAQQNKISNYQEMLIYLLGERIGKVFDILLSIFLFLGISTMLSASGAVFYEHLYQDKILGILLAYALILLMLLGGKKGLIASYNYLVPIKIILLLITTVYVICFFQANESEIYTYAFLQPKDFQFWTISSILYVAYNFSLAMVILTEYQSVSSRRNSIIGAALGGIVLGVLLVLIYLAMYKFLPGVLHYEVPMLFVAGQISISAKYIYTIVLWMGILTTALANAYGIAQRFSKFSGLSYGFSLILCVSLALPLALQSFAILIRFIYPLFGLLGVLLLLSIILKTIKEKQVWLYYKK